MKNMCLQNWKKSVLNGFVLEVTTTMSQQREQKTIQIDYRDLEKNETREYHLLDFFGISWRRCSCSSKSCLCCYWWIHSFTNWNFTICFYHCWTLYFHWNNMLDCLDCIAENKFSRIWISTLWLILFSSLLFLLLKVCLWL